MMLRLMHFDSWRVSLFPRCVLVGRRIVGRPGRPNAIAGDGVGERAGLAIDDPDQSGLARAGDEDVLVLLVDDDLAGMSVGFLALVEAVDGSDEYRGTVGTGRDFMDALEGILAQHRDANDG